MSWFKNLLSCPGCESRKEEMIHLRAEVSALQTLLASAHDMANERIMKMAKECNDRIMARSYTEYAVGNAAQAEPMEPRSRSDEEEWLIEQKRHLEIEHEAQSVMRSLDELKD